MLEGDERIPSILKPNKSLKESMKNRARLIQKIYEVDLLPCPKCSGEMMVSSVIEEEEIKKLLKKLGLLDRKARPLPRTGALEPNDGIDTSDSQVPPFRDHLYCAPEYPIEVYASCFSKTSENLTYRHVRFRSNLSLFPLFCTSLRPIHQLSHSL